MPIPSSASLADALAHHQRGEIDQAAQLYQKILAVEPDNAEAVRLLGVAAMQRGQLQQAVSLLERAVALSPSSAVFHNDLGDAYRACGQAPRAAASYQIALRLQPEAVETAVNLGSLLMQGNQPAEAVKLFRHVLQHQPNHAVAHNNLGNAFRLLGDAAQAQTCYQRAIELNPQLGFAYGNLGQLLVDNGRPQEALPFCEHAVRLQPQVAAAHNNLGNVYRDLGRLDQARFCYTQALRLDPHLAVIHDNLGRVAHGEGRFDEAAAWFRQAVQLAPNTPLYLRQLGETLVNQRDFDQAEKCLRAALQGKPGDGETCFHLARLFHERGQLDQAQAAYRALLRGNPHHPLLNQHLGELLLEINHMDEALSCFRDALRGNPNYVPALAQLANHLRDRLPDEDRQTMRRLLDNPALPPGERVSLLYGVAHTCEATSEYDQAAQHFERANTLEQTLRKKSGQVYHADAHAAFIKRMGKIFTPEFFERTRGFGLDSERPVFIVGLPRSGTSLLEQVLASHSRVHGAGEQFFARQGFEMLGGGSDGHAEQRAFDRLKTIDADSVQRLAQVHLERLDALHGTADRVIDKMPENYQYVGFLRLLFPRARILHCRRDLRDVAVSCWTTQFRQVPWASDLGHLASRFAQYQRIMEHWYSVLPDVLMPVDYEDMVNDLEAVARRVLAFCGLDWEPACLEFHRTTRPVRTASLTQVRQPIYRRSLARWRNYEKPLRPLFKRLERLLEQPQQAEEEIEAVALSEHGG